MNTIDIHDGLIRNLEFEARKNAQLDNIYENERIKYPYCPETQNTNMYNKLSSIENRLSIIENRIEELHDIVVNLNEGNGLFTFSKNQNVKEQTASFSLSESQFKELIKMISK